MPPSAPRPHRLVIVVMLGLVLAAIGAGIWHFANLRDQVRHRYATQHARYIVTAVLSWMAAHNDEPLPNGEALLALLVHENVVRDDMLVDPWGHRFTITIETSEECAIRVTGFGADGAPGGDGADADIMVSNCELSMPAHP
jgi:hypothetical protein